jgi:hypothetical protein
VAETAESAMAREAPIHQQELASNQRMTDLVAEQDAQTERYNRQNAAAEVEAQAHQHALLKDKATAVEAANQKVAAAEQAIRTVDPKHFWHSLSTGQQAAGLISGFLDGWLAPNNGGRNAIMDQINTLIDRDMTAQQLGQEQDKFMVGQAEKDRDQVRQTYGDLLADADLQRAARLRAILADHQAQMASIQSPITREKGAQLAIQLEQEYVKSINAAHEKEVAGTFQALQARTAIKGQQQAAAAQSRAAKFADKQLALEGAKSGRVYNPQTGQWEVDPNAPSDPTEALKVAKLQAETGKAQSDAIKAAKEANPGVGDLVQSDGKTPIQARDITEAKEITNKRAGVDTMARLADDIEALRDLHGSELFKSEAYRQLKSDHAQLSLMVAQDAKLGALASEDLKLVGNMLGTNDPTEFRDIAGGLKQFRANAVNNFNTYLHSIDPKAARYEPPKSGTVAAGERSHEDNAKIISAPIPDYAAKNETERKKFLDQKAGAIDVETRHNKGLTASNLGSWARDIDKEVQRGTISQAEAAEQVTKLVPKILKEEKENIQHMSKAELVKLQSDPAFMQRAMLRHLVDSGNARPNEIYQLVLNTQ